MDPAAAETAEPLPCPLRLLPHQVDHVARIQDVLARHSFYIDSSVPGSGKTYATSWVAQQGKFKHMVVVCPATVEKTWQDVATLYGLPVRLIVSFESLRSCKGCQPKHPFLTRGEATEAGGMFNATEAYHDLVQDGVLLVADEIQRVKNKSAQRAAFEALARPIHTAFLYGGGPSRCALLSGSPFDKIEHVLNLLQIFVIRHPRLFVFHTQSGILELKGALDVVSAASAMDGKATELLLQRHPFRRKTVEDTCYQLFVGVIGPRVSVAMPPPAMPVALCCFNGYYSLDREKTLELASGVTALRSAACYNETTGQVVMGGPSAQSWGALSLALQSIETAKCQLFVRLARDVLTSNPNSKVVLAFNFLQNVESAAALLGDFKPAVLTGSVSKPRRADIIASFQHDSGDARLIIGIQAVLEVGINLDDIIGDRPRFAFASPSYLVIRAHQFVRRFYRSFTASRPTVAWVYGLPCEPVGEPMEPTAQATCETSVLAALARKTKVLEDTLPVQRAAGVMFPGDYPSVINPPPDFNVPM